MAAKSADCRPSPARDQAKRARFGRGTGQLSDLFLQPDSVEQMRAIAARAAAETPMTEAMLRQIIQAPAEWGASGRW